MADGLFDTSPFQTEAVEENKLLSLPCPPTSSQDFSDDEHDGPSGPSPNQLTSDQIKTALAASVEDKIVKITVRNQQMHFKNPLRCKMWKALYIRMEAFAGSTTDALNAASLAEATAQLYHETIQSCYGTKELSSEDVGLPSCVEPKMTQSFFLSNHGKLTVARIMTCFAYNQPDIQYCPMLHPIASIFRHYLSGKIMNLKMFGF